METTWQGIKDFFLGDTDALSAAWSHPLDAISNDWTAFWHNNGQNPVVNDIGDLTGVDGYAGSSLGYSDPSSVGSSSNSTGNTFAIGFFGVLIVIGIIAVALLLKEAREV